MLKLFCGKFLIVFLMIHNPMMESLHHTDAIWQYYFCTLLVSVLASQYMYALL